MPLPWRKPEDIFNRLKKDLAEELLNEPLMLDQVKVDDFLLVALDVRPCSFLTVPAEFPNGLELGRQIDEICRQDYQALMDADIYRKAELILNLRNRIRESFKTVVGGSGTYKAHLNWAERLSLQTSETEVRPSVHEIYLFKNTRIREELKKLTKMRQQLREKMLRSATHTQPEICLAYPEEGSPEYLASVGKLLGYPSCCVDRYLNDRLQGSPIVEQRVSEQIRELKSEVEANTFAFFVKDFFPCSPSCERAIEIGAKGYSVLKSISPHLGEIFLNSTKSNVRTAERYPELIKLSKKGLEEQAARLRTQKDEDLRQKGKKRPFLSVFWF